MERKAVRVVEGMETHDGAGVKLLRIMGQPDLDQLDPFLLLDEFKSENRDDYIAGFPPHPHRGFETVTYMKYGKFRHRDSRGNEGLLSDGSVQWMTAGRGIIHSEMPEMSDGLLWGYQLWINLPAKLKMIEAGYQDISREEMPVVEDGKAKVKIISGEFHGKKGPARNRLPFDYFDVEVEENGSFETPAPAERSAMVYLYEGSLEGLDKFGQVKEGNLIIFGEGDSLKIKAGSNGAGFLFFSADRIGEPVARGGPFVMNTREEVLQAFADFQAGRLGRY